jgi:peptidoglycan/LPS O-acetylase OafA/YrhL
LQGWLWAYAANVYQAWQGAYALGWFNHFWSLAVEEHFYLVWPVVVFLCTRRAAMAVCAGFILLAAGLRAWIITRTGNAVAIDVLTPCRMDALATGGLLALVARGPAGLGGLLRWARPGAVVTGVVLAAVLLSGRTFWFLPLTLWAFFFGAMLIVALGVRPQSWAGRALHGRPLRFLGKYSYGLYVFQNLLIPVVAPVLTLAGAIAAVGSDLGGRLLYLMVMSPAAVAAALLSWHLYEQPFLRLKRFFHGRRVAPAGGP